MSRMPESLTVLVMLADRSHSSNDKPIPIQVLGPLNLAGCESLQSNTPVGHIAMGKGGPEGVQLNNCMACFVWTTVVQWNLP